MTVITDFSILLTKKSIYKAFIRHKMHKLNSIYSYHQDLRHLSRQPLAPSSVVRALNHSLSTGSPHSGSIAQKWPGNLAVSTSYSQPSSPMKKEPSPFRYSGINQQLTATPPVSISCFLCVFDPNIHYLSLNFILYLMVLFSLHFHLKLPHPYQPSNSQDETLFLWEAMPWISTGWNQHPWLAE